jgi:hypothetical protein
MALPHRYGGRHQKLREKALLAYRRGETRCVRCGLPINETDLSKLHLDHDPSGRGYLGPWPHLSHSRCNTTAPHRKYSVPPPADPVPGLLWRVRTTDICGPEVPCKYRRRADGLHPPGRCWA